MNESKLQVFLSKINIERKQLQHDLDGIPISSLRCKIGDFGCGWGYTVWALLYEIPLSQCIGIDKFDPAEPPSFEDYAQRKNFSFNTVKNQFIDVAKKLEITKEEKKIPFVIKGDIVTGKNLPTNFDLIYCKRLLYNIYSRDGTESNIRKSLHNIANALNPSGWLCVVEINEPQFMETLHTILVQKYLELKSCRKVVRPYKTIESKDQSNYLICQYKKNKK